MLQEKEQPTLDAIGVFIYDIYGKLTSTEDWDEANNDKAVGVYVGNENHRFVVAKENASDSKVWGGFGKQIEGIVTTNDKAQAELDFDGQGNTAKIIEQLNGYTDSAGITGAPAAETCANYIFPNGQNGYLGSTGEWKMFADNKSTIDTAISKCGGSKLSGTYWTSTQVRAHISWYYYHPTAVIANDYSKNSAAKVRAFLAV